MYFHYENMQQIYKIKLTVLTQICSIQIHVYTNVYIVYTSIYKTIVYITATQLTDFFHSIASI